jgi:hypothetical protein
MSENFSLFCDVVLAAFAGAFAGLMAAVMFGSF